MLLSPYLSPSPPPPHVHKSILYVYFSIESESEVAQSCPTLCDPVDCSLPGSSVHGISQARNSGVGYHFLLQGNIPHPGIEPVFSVLAGDSLPVSHVGSLLYLVPFHTSQNGCDPKVYKQ